MANIHIRRDHQLGLAKARKIAWRWAEDVEKDFDMSCTVEEGDDSDTVAFTRSGVDGQLTVTADHFELDAKLGFLLGAFAKTIEAQIQQRLDQLLEAQGGKASTKSAASKAAAPKSAAAKPGVLKPAGAKKSAKR